MSALPKLYFAEGSSHDVDDLLTRESGRVVIGELAILEMRCALSRHTRDLIRLPTLPRGFGRHFNQTSQSGMSTWCRIIPMISTPPRA
jgi:hypothetical protein